MTPDLTSDAVTERAVTEQPFCETPRYAIFAECPQCHGSMQPEHAHYRCTQCGWRDSCCD